MQGRWKVEEGNLAYYDGKGELVGYLFHIDLSVTWPWAAPRVAKEAMEALTTTIEDATSLEAIRRRLMGSQDQRD